MSTVLACGGRGVENKAAVFACLDVLHSCRPVAKLLHGGARGADRLAALWAERRGIPVEAHPADWSQGKGAGPARNARMIALRPDLVIAFPGGPGTADAVRRARAAGIEVIDLRCNSTDAES